MGCVCVYMQKIEIHFGDVFLIAFELLRCKERLQPDFSLTTGLDASLSFLSTL